MPDILNTQEPDECCSRPWQKAALRGLLDNAKIWTCPRCGCDWEPKMIEGAIRHWEPKQWYVIVK